MELAVLCSCQRVKRNRICINVVQLGMCLGTAYLNRMDVLQDMAQCSLLSLSCSVVSRVVRESGPGGPRPLRRP